MQAYAQNRKQLAHSTTDVARVKASCDGRIRRPFDDRSSVREQGHLVGLAPEFQDELIVTHRAMRTQTNGHLNEVHRALLLVNLHGISAAERDMGAPFSGQVDEVSLAAGAASGERPGRGNLRALVSPDVPGEEAPPH